MAVPDPSEGRAPGEFPPLGGPQAQLQARPGVEGAGAAPEGRVAPEGGPVPRADLLAEVAPGGPAAGRQARDHPWRGLGLGLDGVGGQAAGRVQEEGGQGTGGADLQAGGAGACLLYTSDAADE